MFDALSVPKSNHEAAKVALTAILWKIVASVARGSITAYQKHEAQTDINGIAELDAVSVMDHENACNEGLETRRVISYIHSGPTLGWVARIL